MAEILDDFEFRRYRKYPWDEWTDGRIWKLSPGTDFTTSRKNLVSVVRQRAKAHGESVSVTTFGKEYVVLQFHNDNERT